MSNESLVIERLLNAPASRVWDAITNKEQMRQWYFNVSDFRPEPGFEFSFRGESSDCHEYLHLCQVKEVIQGKKISYSWRYDGIEGDSLVTFELFEEGPATRLKLTHEGLHSFPADRPNFTRSSFTEGWTELIGSALPGFLERAAEPVAPRP